MKADIGILISGLLILGGVMFGMRERHLYVVANRSRECGLNRAKLAYAKEEFVQRHVDQNLWPADHIAPTIEQITPYLKGGTNGLVCPAGGLYTIGRMDQEPSCSFHGHDNWIYWVISANENTGWGWWRGETDERGPGFFSPLQRPLNALAFIFCLLSLIALIAARRWQRFARFRIQRGRSG